jgi:hypothetical protein
MRCQGAAHVGGVGHRVGQHASFLLIETAFPPRRKHIAMWAVLQGHIQVCQQACR